MKQKNNISAQTRWNHLTQINFPCLFSFHRKEAWRLHAQIHPHRQNPEEREGKVEPDQQQGKPATKDPEEEEGSNVLNIEKILKLSKARKTFVSNCRSTDEDSEQVDRVLKKAIARRLDRLSLMPN